MTLHRFEITDEQHIRLMLTLLEQRSIIRQAIQRQKELGEKVPERWTDRELSLTELIEAIQDGK